MAKITIIRPNGDLLWEGERESVTFNPDGTFTWLGAAMPVSLPWLVVPEETKEDDGR